MKRKIFIIIFALVLSAVSYSQEKKYTTYRVTDNDTVTSIAKKLGITPFDLLKLNPDAKNGINIDEVLIVPNKNYKPSVTEVRPPVKQTISYKDSIKDGILYHRVKYGETIYSLCKRYGAKKKKIYKLNNLTKRSKISIGQLLKFPTDKEDTQYETSENTTADIVTNNEPHITYIVKANDTKYSLARNNGVSVEELERINPQLKGKTLNEYDVILLPRKQEVQVEDNTVDQTVEPSYLEHEVAPKETMYSLTKKYEVTSEELLALNPELAEGLKEGMILKVPKKSVQEEITYRTHTVQPKETYYGLGKMYGVTQEDLMVLNPELTEGLKEGMVLRIPEETIEVESLLNLDEIFEGKKVEVAMLLPFRASEKKNAELDEDKMLNRITDFYLGATLAIEELKNKGLSVDVQVLDTKGKRTGIVELVNDHDLSNRDLVIGPMYYRNVSQLSKTLVNETPIISPVANNDHSQIKTKNVIQNNTPRSALERKMIDFIKENYSGQNIIIIAEEEKKSKESINKIVNRLKLHDSIQKVSVLHIEDGYIKNEKVEEQLTDKKENWVIVASDVRSTCSNVVDILGVQSEEVKVTLFALNDDSNFKSIKNTFLNRLNFHYATSSFIDKENEKVKDFDTRYKNTYGVYPTDFVYAGYDTTHDALIRIATYNNLEDSFQKGLTQGLSKNFNYNQDIVSQHYINTAVFIVKFQDFEKVKLE